MKIKLMFRSFLRRLRDKIYKSNIPSDDNKDVSTKPSPNHIAGRDSHPREVKKVQDIISTKLPRPNRIANKGSHPSEIKKAQDITSIKPKPNLITSRDDHLRDVKKAQGITSIKPRPNRITINDIVVIEDIETGKKGKIQVVAGEVDPKNGKITIETPLAQALIGRKIGDYIQVTPEGIREFIVIDTPPFLTTEISSYPGGIRDFIIIDIK